MNFTYRKFQPETDTLKPFDCGDTDLNGFLVETSHDTPNATMYERDRLFPPLLTLLPPGAMPPPLRSRRVPSGRRIAPPSRHAADAAIGATVSNQSPKIVFQQNFNLSRLFCISG